MFERTDNRRRIPIIQVCAWRRAGVKLSEISQRLGLVDGARFHPESISAAIRKARLAGHPAVLKMDAARGGGQHGS